MPWARAASRLASQRRWRSWNSSSGVSSRGGDRAACGAGSGTGACRFGGVGQVAKSRSNLVVDECHHISAVSFEAVARRAKAKYVFGLSATVKGHAHRLAECLARFARNVLVLRGGMGARQRRAVMQRLEEIPETEERVLIATGRYVGEGFDDARLDTLFLAMPISWKGTLAQYVGRLHAAKREVVVHDYVDGAVPALIRMSEKRVRGYESLGYSVEQAGRRIVAGGRRR